MIVAQHQQRYRWEVRRVVRLAQGELVDTFLPGHLRGFADPFLRADKVCPGFGQRQRMGGATGTRPASPCHPASTFGWHLNLPIFFPKSWNRSADQSDAAEPKCWSIDCDPGHDPGSRTTDFLTRGVRRCARCQPLPEIHGSSHRRRPAFCGRAENS
jgi:hypothetical protein